MAELAKEFQLMKEFQRLRERSNAYLLDYQERLQRGSATSQPSLTDTEVVHAFMLTNAACFDLLMRQEHEWQMRIQELQDGWEEKAQAQASKWKVETTTKEQQHTEGEAAHQHFMAAANARMEQLNEAIKAAEQNTAKRLKR